MPSSPFLPADLLPTHCGIRTVTLGVATWALILTGLSAQADEPTPGWQYKFTPSRYMTSGETSGTDLNLRANTPGHTWWVGHYQRGAEFQQTRVGYERTRAWAMGQWTLSLQAASHGFAGGSVSIQVGSDAVYGVLGYGRTNAQTYYNLNFDPNDAVTLGLGGHWQGHELSLAQVHDDRLHTGQRVTHLVWRYHRIPGQRLSVDLARKAGRAASDGPWLQGHSLSLSWDWSGHVVRLARDQRVNFSDDTQTRVSLAWRF